MIRCNRTMIGKSSAALCGTTGLLALANTAQAQTTVKTATLTPQVAQQLTQVSQAGIPAGTASYAEMLALDAGGRQNTVDIAGRAYPFAIRLGAMLSPRIKFVGGADLTIPSLGIGQNWVGRIDAEAIVSANFGGNSTVVPLTFDEVYFSPSKTSGLRPYAGLGVGPYFASTTRFGGKFFVGARFSQRISGEASLHFSGAGDPLLVLQARTSL
ncbi:MAG: hypothetical protein JWL77_4458 [Chthonomonadaceae bacterium]|nr:hypothetical protein [Chthonomonadaceae bacterium]